MGGGALNRVATLTAIILASAAQAEELQNYWSNEGDTYFATVNENGVALTSKFPKTWFHGEPSQDHQVVTKPAVIYLGNDCDALHNEYGAGKWSGANGGFGATFGEHTIYFGRQELPEDQFAKCYTVEN